MIKQKESAEFLVIKPAPGIHLAPGDKPSKHIIPTPEGDKAYPSILVHKLHDPEVTLFYWRERTDRLYKGKLSSAKIKLTR